MMEVMIPKISKFIKLYKDNFVYNYYTLHKRVNDNAAKNGGIA